MEKEIKEEATDDFEYTQYGGPSGCRPISPNHPDLRTDNLAETLASVHDMPGKKNHSTPPSAIQGVPSSAELKPWFPSAKGRSIVWDHITWLPDTQRAACNYCSADFQIKGGTSALLRHLKTMHPAAINFDPENPPPVVRRKPKKKVEDYTIVNADTKSYMDNLLEQFLQDDNAPRNEPPASQMQAQSRADSEIDEVIRNLQKETAQNGLEPPEQDQDLRKLLGIDEENGEEVLAENHGLHEHIPAAPHHTNSLQNPDEEKQVSSSSGQNGKKRKNDELRMNDPSTLQVSYLGPDAFKHKKLSLSFMSPSRRPTPHSNGQPPPAPSNAAQAPPPPPQAAPTSSSSGTPAIPTRYSTQAVQCLDFEAKVLYNQSMHSTIAREDAMTSYYRMKARKVELECKKLEREQSRAVSPYDQEHDD